MTKKELRREKHPGKDDVLLLYLDDGRAIQIDRLVFEKIDVGDELDKRPWQRQLTIGEAVCELSWSEDTRGMAIAMPVIFALLAATACRASCLVNRVASAFNSGNNTADSSGDRFE